MTALSELFTAETADEIVTDILTIAQTLGLPATSWAPLGRLRTMVASVGQKLADVHGFVASTAKGGFLDYAEDGWIQILSTSNFGETPTAATFASGDITIVNGSTGTLTYAVGALHVANPTTTKTYHNTVAISLSAGNTASYAFAADEAGSGSSAGPTTITQLVSPVSGVTISNALAFVGTDEDSTALIAAKCRSKFGALSPNGPKDAYIYFALKAPTSVPVTRAIAVVNVSADGTVNVYGASASGALSGADVTILQSMIDTWAETLTDTAIAASATTAAIAVTGTVYITAQAGLTTAAAQSAISNAIAAYFASVPIGGTKLGAGTTGYALIEGIRNAVMMANPLTVNVTLSAPSGDTTLLATDVPALSSSTFTVVFQ